MRRLSSFCLAILLVTLSTGRAHAWSFERWDYLATRTTVLDLAACPDGELFALDRTADGVTRVLQYGVYVDPPAGGTGGPGWGIVEGSQGYYGRSSIADDVSISCGRSSVTGRSEIILVQAASGARPQQVWAVDVNPAYPFPRYNEVSQRVALVADPACGPLVGPHVSLLGVAGALGNETIDVVRFDPGMRRIDVDSLRRGSRSTLMATAWLWAARDASAARAPNGTMTVTALNDPSTTDRWWIARNVTAATGYAFTPEGTPAGSWNRFVSATLANSSVEVETAVQDVDAFNAVHVYVRTNIGQVWHGLARF